MKKICPECLEKGLTVYLKEKKKIYCPLCKSEFVETDTEYDLVKIEKNESQII